MIFYEVKLNTRNLFFKALICAVIYYLGSKLLFEIFGYFHINSIMMVAESDSVSVFLVIVIYFREIIVVFLPGVLYSSLNHICYLESDKFRLSLNIRWLLLWALPSAVLILWYIVWWFFYPQIVFPILMVNSYIIMIPPSIAVMQFILGYVFFASLFQKNTQYRSIVRPIVFFAIMIVAFLFFNLFVGFPVQNYTSSEYFLMFVLLVGLGAFFGYTYYLSGESQKTGKWVVNWGNLIGWCTFCIGFLIYTVIMHLDTYRGQMRASTILLMFILGNAIITSLYKKNTREVGNGID
jgi:hypothetical protein